jgi:hypothetical protein
MLRCRRKPVIRLTQSQRRRRELRTLEIVENVCRSRRRRWLRVKRITAKGRELFLMSESQRYDGQEKSPAS